MSIEAKFNIPLVADLALREKQIQQIYRPIIAVHKWFARRPGTLFRALTLAEFGEAPPPTFISRPMTSRDGGSPIPSWGAARP